MARGDAGGPLSPDETRGAAKRVGALPVGPPKEPTNPEKRPAGHESIQESPLEELAAEDGDADHGDPEPDRRLNLGDNTAEMVEAEGAQPEQDHAQSEAQAGHPHVGEAELLPTPHSRAVVEPERVGHPGEDHADESQSQPAGPLERHRAGAPLWTPRRTFATAPSAKWPSGLVLSKMWTVGGGKPLKWEAYDRV